MHRHFLELWQQFSDSHKAVLQQQGAEQFVNAIQKYLLLIS